MRPVVIVDTETTSLTPDYEGGSGVIWEIAVIERGSGTERLWRMQTDALKADPRALEVGRYWERTETMRRASPGEIRGRFRPAAVWRRDVWDLAREDNPPCWSDPADLAEVLARSVLKDATLLGAVPSSGTRFLSAFLTRYGQDPQPWHYRIRDIGSMAWAWLQAHHLPHHLPIPAMDAGTDDFAGAMGLDPADYDRHTALGDCRLVAAMLDLIEDGAAR